jgi:hypothetical protein
MMLAKTGILMLTALSLLGSPNQSGRASGIGPAATDIPSVSLCSLLGKPADYDGKEVRLRATYNIGFEWSYFDAPGCKEYAVETTPYWTANVAWAEFDESVMSSVRPELLEKLKRARSLCPDDMFRTQETEMRVTGRFLKGKSVEEGYGHMGRYAYKLVVSGVGEAGDTKPGCPKM